MQYSHDLTNIQENSKLVFSVGCYQNLARKSVLFGFLFVHSFLVLVFVIFSKKRDKPQWFQQQFKEWYFYSKVSSINGAISNAKNKYQMKKDINWEIFVLYSYFKMHQEKKNGSNISTLERIAFQDLQVFTELGKRI